MKEMKVSGLVNIYVAKASQPVMPTDCTGVHFFFPIIMLSKTILKKHIANYRHTPG